MNSIISIVYRIIKQSVSPTWNFGRIVKVDWLNTDRTAAKGSNKSKVIFSYSIVSIYFCSKLMFFCCIPKSNKCFLYCYSTFLYLICNIPMLYLQQNKASHVFYKRNSFIILHTGEFIFIERNSIFSFFITIKNCILQTAKNKL